MDRSGETYAYHFDGLGSTRVVTDQSQLTTHQYTYDAYGNVLSSSETVSNPYQFVAAFGYYSDPDTGLLYLRARYYSPSIGRFVSLDSYLGQAEDPASLHRYGYCGSNPMVLIDPSGNIWWIIIGVIGGAVISGFLNAKLSGGSFWAGFAAGGLTTATALINPVLGAVVGAATSAALTASNGDTSAGGLVGSAIIGAIAGYAGGLLPCDPDAAIKEGLMEMLIQFAYGFALPLASAYGGYFGGIAEDMLNSYQKNIEYATE